MANDDAYFMALGRFVHAFSEVEKAIHYSFANFTKLKIPIAHIIKRESGAKDLISIIKQTVRLNKFSDKAIAEVECLFTHFDAISIFRNRVLHRGAYLQEDGTYLSHNMATMRTMEAYEMATFTLEDIQFATRDLGRMAIRIYDVANVTPYHQMTKRDPRAAPLLLAPWQYKSVELVTPNKARPSKSPVPSRPPPASR